ncbi:MAG: T9SS type A sorting domain-containing protein [Ferruginibacter sp.]
MKNLYLLALTMFAFASSTFSQATSTVVGGDWSDPLTWTAGAVPTATDDVIISDGAMVIIDQDATVASLTVGQGNSGILEYEVITARTVTVTNDVTINAGGIFRSSINGTITSHVLSVDGNIINNGSLDFSTNGNTAGTEIIFTGAANTSFTGTGAITDVYAITVNKGSSAASIVELSTDAFSFQGSTSTSGNIQSFLNIINGTFKISGTFTMDNGVFAGTGAYTIPATGGFWLNNPNFTVNARGGTANVDGTLQVDAGTMNIGNAANNRLGYINGSVIIINGGVVNVASRVSATTTFGVSYMQTGGTLNVNTVSNTSGSRASFDIQDNGDNSSFTMSGGSIVLQNANISGSGNRDYFNDATNINITGGTVQVGNALSGSAQTFFLSGAVPSLLIDNTAGGHTAQLLNDLNVFGNTTINLGTTLNLNDAAGTGHTYTQRGSSFVNDGTVDGTVAGSTLTFAGTSAQDFGGTGSLTAPLQNLQMNNVAGLTITNPVATDIITFSLSMLAGDINTGVNTLTVGTGTATPGIFTYTSGTVVGKFKRWYDATVSARNFPVGIPGTTRNANILFTTAPTTGGTLTAEWVSQYGGTNGLPLTEPGYPAITNTAADGYWTIIAADGLSGGLYTGTFIATNVVTVIDFTELVLVKRADAVSPWTLDGIHVPTTGSNTTPILQRTGMSGFSDFAIGGSGTSLPIKIEYFKGTKQTAGNLLDWKVSCTNTPTATMVIERSNDARTFSALTSITATAVRCLQSFDYIDYAPNAGINYYRIKLSDADGKFTYSSVIAILNKENGFDIISMSPNPVISNGILTIASALKARMEIVVTDVTGKKVSARSVNLLAGSNQVFLDLSNLAAGSYQVTGRTSEGSKTIRFIKN